MKSIIKKTIFLLVMILLAITLSAQESGEKAYEKAKEEIVQTYGFFPMHYQAIPKYALSEFWQYNKAMDSTEKHIPPKYLELIKLAVAAERGCPYCIYAHTTAIKKLGGTDEEIKEAIMEGARTRQWSMILEGNQIDLEAFKEEFEAIRKYQAEKVKNE